MNAQLSFRNKINTLWAKLTGDPNVFRLESRLFHAICLIVISSLVFNVPFNFIISQPVAGLLNIIGAVVFLALYWRSRFKGKIKGSIFVCIILTNILFFINYFYNSGITGPNDIVFALSLFFTIFLSPYKQHKYWFGLNVLILLTMHGIEYYQPRIVPYTYLSRRDHFSDNTWAYLLTVLGMYFTIKAVRRNYDHERLLAEEKTRSIEDQHQYILAQNEQLEQLNTEKNKLMSIIAHDLRAPLSNIQNYLELVAAYGLDQEEREVVEGDLLKVTQSTLNMLSKLLIWSKSQMDGVVVKLSDMNLSETLKNTMEMERILALKKEIILTYHIDPAITVVADSDMLQLVLRNLASNAIKFTPVGGKVDIRTEIVMNDCKISVTDNGRGIPFEQQVDIFSLKARSTFGTNNEKGVGLGLLLCKEFTEQQGGRIGFESTPGHGSTFFVYTPMG